MNLLLPLLKKHCRTEVLSELGLEYDLFITTLFAKADRDAIPLSGAFELTSRCTLNCRMCYIHRKENDCEALRQEKSTEWWLNLAEEAKNAGMFMLLLTGGEPLLRKDFEEIYLGAKKMGLLVSVNTNGMLIDDEKIKLFTDNPPQKLNISLYGASYETYRDLCGNGEAYEKVISAITKLKQAGINVKINFTATQYNRHDAEKIYELSEKLSVPVQTVSYMFPPVRAGGEADRLSPEEAAEIQFGCQLLGMGAEKLKAHLKNKAKPPTPCNTEECSDSSGERISCRAGLSTFWVTWDGKMSPCGMLTRPVSDISSFSEAWNNIKNSRSSIVLPPKCRNCSLRKYCDVCAAVTLSETGDFGIVPDYVCRKAASYKKLCDSFDTG